MCHAGRIVKLLHVAGQTNAVVDNGAAFIEEFKFEVTNMISTSQQKDKQQGIGVENIKKRLEHIYGDKASFEVLEKEDTFTAKLLIPIK